MPALDQEADDAGPLRLPGVVERVWRGRPDSTVALTGLY